MKTLKIGIIGAGGIVRQRHLPGLRNIPGVEIAAVANSTLASAQAFCDELAPEAKAFEKWEDVVALPDLDIIWIGATPQLHRPATLAALKAGKHVFCQARMARNLLEAEEMLAASKDRPDLVTMLCPPPYGLKADAYIKKILSDEVLGEITGIRLQSFNDAFLDTAKPAHWRQRRELSGNNILSLGIHTEIIQRWLGDFQVNAAQGQIRTTDRDNYEITIPDALQVLVELENDALGVLEFSAIHSGVPREQLEISGTKGVLVYNYATEEIHLQKPGGVSPELLQVPTELSGGWNVEADFIAAVRTPSAPRPHPDFTDGVAYMNIVDEVAEFL